MTPAPAPLTPEERDALVDLLDYSDGHGGRRLRSREEQEFVISTWALTERGQRFLAERAGAGRLREALDDTTRLLEYLWSATGNRAPDMPVHDLFNDDDPIIDDMLTTLGRARMVLHGATPAPRALDAEPGQPR